MNRNIIFALLLCGLFAASTPTTQAENWPGWRGPRGDGSCIEKNIPDKWDPADAIWKTELPGKGHASAIVWGDRVAGLETGYDVALGYSPDNGRGGSRTSTSLTDRGYNSGRSSGINTSLTDRAYGFGGRSGRAGGTDTSLTDNQRYRGGYGDYSRRAIGGGYLGNNGRGAQVTWSSTPAGKAVAKVCAQVAQRLKAAIHAANSR